MNVERKNNQIWPFVIQLVALFFILPVFWWSITPTDELYGPAGLAHRNYMNSVSGACVFLGLLGLKYAKDLPRFRVRTKILSIINLVVGSLPFIELLIQHLSLILFGVPFWE